MKIFALVSNLKKFKAKEAQESDFYQILYIAFIGLLLGVLVFALATVVLMKEANAATWSVCGNAKRITCVVDGDTFWKDGIKYRLFNVDTPEAGDRAKCSRERGLANKAASRLQSIFNTGRLVINKQGHDRYGRVLAVVSVNRANVSAQLISEGVGKTYRGGKRDPHYWCR